MLLPEPAELPRHELARDPLARERRRELVQRALERSRVLAERVDERRPAVRRQVERLRLRSLQDPGRQLLALDLDLGHRPDALDELHERRRRLRPVAHHRDQDRAARRGRAPRGTARARGRPRRAAPSRSRPGARVARRTARGSRGPRSRHPATARRPPRPAAGRRGARARPPAGGTRPRPTAGSPARPSGSRGGLYNHPSALERDRHRPRPIGSNTSAPVARIHPRTSGTGWP